MSEQLTIFDFLNTEEEKKDLREQLTDSELELVNQLIQFRCTRFYSQRVTDLIDGLIRNITRVQL